jgi:hypothetical protein
MGANSDLDQGQDAEVLTTSFQVQLSIIFLLVYFSELKSNLLFIHVCVHVCVCITASSKTVLVTGACSITLFVELHTESSTNRDSAHQEDNCRFC